MKRLRLHYLLIVTLIFSAVCYAQDHHSSEPQAEETPSENSNLLDEFGALPHCDLTGRYDLFFAELSKNPESHGYVLIYQGTDGLPATYDSPPMERMFRNHMAFRRFDAARVTVINGGFQEQGKTQLWIVPPGAEPPTPESTVRKPKIPTNKTFLFDRSYLGLEEEDVASSEYVLPSVKAEREAEQKKWEEEARLERIAAGEEQEDVEGVSDEAVEPTAEHTEAMDQAEEDQTEDKFYWVSEPFGALLSNREGARGVIIFYADDERFDIAKIRRLVEEGVDRMSKTLWLKGPRISVVFGGYRNSTDVEYWVVPKLGKAPVPTPEERTVEDVAEAEHDN